LTRAVFFDVDFTLIYPGPMFGAEGYHAFCARHGIEVDPLRFDHAVASAALSLEDAEDVRYDDEIWLAYTRHIIEKMGGHGPAVHACARDIYDEWGACEHFELYDEVPAVLRELAAAGLRLGLISNSHRCLASFQAHFDLRGLINAAVSSSQHGFMKPHGSIFMTALRSVGVMPQDAIMVGDSVKQDVEGALAVGMGAILLHRGGTPPPRAAELAARGVRVIGSLAELPPLCLDIER
jgi:putative hydrolase of the HAD superfamily